MLPAVRAIPQGRRREVFRTALWLGLTSFGGPVAHIGYFERAYVERRQWLSRDDFAGLVALCQLVPGPASSQLGLLVGLRRAGWLGALAAWVGFTLPSALGLVGLALVLRLGGGLSPLALGVLHGFKLVAVAIVAQAVWTMARSLCPDGPRRLIAGAALATMLVAADGGAQILALAMGGMAGAALCAAVARPSIPLAIPVAMPVSRRAGVVALGLFAGVLVLVILGTMAGLRGPLGMAAIFYRAGALVFGGGHVVLPLLHEALVPTGWLDDQRFLAGYGAAQAIPGPLFTLAAYLGAACAPAGSGWLVTILWSAAALVAIFLPGVLVVIGALPLWQWLGRHARAQGALAGINAAVVGLLAAALYNPVGKTTLVAPADWGIAVAGLVLLVRWRAPPVVVVALTVLASVLTSVMAR